MIQLLAVVCEDEGLKDVAVCSDKSSFLLIIEFV